MFDNEYTAVITLSNGKKISLFVDKGLVVPTGATEEGYLTVNVIRDESPATVLLPSEAFETGSRWAEVRRDKLELVDQ